jgi:hypothetical protein
MPYEIHAYCTSETPPTIRALLIWLRDEENGWGAEAEAPETGSKGLDSSRWTEFFLRYGRERSELESLTLGCYRNTGPRSLCAGMVRGRLERVSEYKESPGKQRVLDCLARTRFIIWCRVDNDPDRERASPVLDLLASMLDGHGAVFDLEDEGFLADSDTPLCGWCAHDE